MSCPRKNKLCKSCLLYKSQSGDFICSGIAKKGTKYKDDKIWLCLKGQLSNRKLELTAHEAAWIVSSLSASLGESLPQILEKNKK